MHFLSPALALVALVVASQAATVTFWTLDDVSHTIYFTPNPGSTEMDPVEVGSQEHTKVVFDDDWAVNFYGVPQGGENKPGMLGEVQFMGWHGKTYFDVSAIVDASDHDNIKQMWPASSLTPMSGCEVFPCNNCYWLSDDVQTKVTEETDLMVTLSTGQTGISFEGY